MRYLGCEATQVQTVYNARPLPYDSDSIQSDRHGLDGCSFAMLACCKVCTSGPDCLAASTGTGSRRVCRLLSSARAVNVNLDDPCEPLPLPS